jgi:hypothetical protein
MKDVTPLERRLFDNRAVRLCAIGLMACLSVLRLGYEFRRLLLDPTQAGAIDLALFHECVHGWFAGEPIYREIAFANSPPATYLMLWPLVGWLSLSAARWLCAPAMAAAVVWLVSLVLRECGAKGSIERAGIALFLTANYATAVTIGNGQLILYVLPSLLAAIAVLGRGKPGWVSGAAVVFLLLFSLIKPHVSVPFFWIVLFTSGGLRVLLPVAIGYAGLTCWAVSFQPEGFSTLIRDLVDQASSLAVSGGYGNLHSWFAVVGLERLDLPVSLLVLIVLGIWVYRNRDGDRWRLLAVVAIVARMWTYHRLYDDLLILVPMVALWRFTRQRPASGGAVRIARMMLLVSGLAMLCPGTLVRLPVPWGTPFRVGYSLLWAAMLLFFIRAGARAARFLR